MVERENGGEREGKDRMGEEKRERKKELRKKERNWTEELSRVPAGRRLKIRKSRQSYWVL